MKLKFFLCSSLPTITRINIHKKYMGNHMLDILSFYTNCGQVKHFICLIEVVGAAHIQQ